MATLILWLVARSGLSKLVIEVIVIASLLSMVGIGWLAVRQHERNIGWNNAIAAVKKQDDRAVAAAEKVEQKASACTEANGWWDVVTQGCKLEDAQ